MVTPPPPWAACPTLNNPFHEEIPLLWHWAFVYRAHSVTSHRATPSKLSSTHSNLEKVLCSPATTVVRTLLWGHLLRHSLPSLSWHVPQLPWHLRGLWFLLQKPLCPCFPPTSVSSGSSNHKFSSNFLAPTALFCAAR